MGTSKTVSGPQAPVREVMTRIPVEVGLSDTLSSVAELMIENDVGALPVVAGGQTRGIVTERDVVRAVTDGVDVAGERASDQMTLQVESVGPDTTVEQATATMLQGGIRHLPVIDGDRLVGMLSIRDLLAAYAAAG
jgi:CBS domain-containing protein